MKKRIVAILLILGVCMIWGCSIIKGKSIDWRYISSDNGNNVLTIIQYLDYRNNNNSAYYIIKGKVEKTRNLPKDNYLKLAINTEPLWIYFGDNGKVDILYGMGKVLENKLEDEAITITRFLHDKEFRELTKSDPDGFMMLYFNKIK